MNTLTLSLRISVVLLAVGFASVLCGCSFQSQQYQRIEDTPTGTTFIVAEVPDPKNFGTTVLTLAVYRGNTTVLEPSYLGRKSWDGKQVRFEVRNLENRFLALGVLGCPQHAIFVLRLEDGACWLQASTEKSGAIKEAISADFGVTLSDLNSVVTFDLYRQVPQAR